MKNERDTYPVFANFIRKYWTHGSAGFELKFARGKHFLLTELPEDQERALRMTVENGIYHKISDQSLGNKPFDSFFLKGNAYLVIYFVSNKTFYGIHSKFITHLKEIGIKRITPDVATEFADFIFDNSGCSKLHIPKV